VSHSVIVENCSPLSSTSISRSPDPSQHGLRIVGAVRSRFTSKKTGGTRWTLLCNLICGSCLTRSHSGDRNSLKLKSDVQPPFRVAAKFQGMSCSFLRYLLVHSFNQRNTPEQPICILGLLVIFAFLSATSVTNLEIWATSLSFSSHSLFFCLCGCVIFTWEAVTRHNGFLRFRTPGCKSSIFSIYIFFPADNP